MGDIIFHNINIKVVFGYFEVRKIFIVNIASGGTVALMLPRLSFIVTVNKL